MYREFGILFFVLSVIGSIGLITSAWVDKRMPITLAEWVVCVGYHAFVLMIPLFAGLFMLELWDE